MRLAAPRPIPARRPTRARRRAILLVLGLAVVTAMAGSAQPGASGGDSLDEAALLGPPAGPPLAGEELEERTLALAQQLRCPVCQGLPISDSPSASALAMLNQTRDLLARGYSQEQVLSYFVRAYGEFVLLEPTREGWNLLVWVLPVAALAAGLLLIARRLRSASRQPAAARGGEGDDVPEDLRPYLERVRSEVES